MRNILFLLCLVVLSSCTSQEGHLKKAALKQGQIKWEKILDGEARESLEQSDWLKQAYIEFILKSSEVEIDDVQFQSEDRATVSVVVKSYSTQLRRTLLKVASQVGKDRSRRFNFAEALEPTSEHSGETAEISERPLDVYKYKKGSDGLWRLE